MYSDSQSLKRDIEENRENTTHMILQQTMSIYSNTSSWKNKVELLNDKQYILLLTQISNKLDNAVMMIWAGNYEQEAYELRLFLDAYSSKANQYAGPFYSQDFTDEDIANAEGLLNDLHLISKWLLDNSERDSLFTIQELKDDGIYEKLQTEDVKFIIGDN